MQAADNIKFYELLKLVKKILDTELSKLKPALDKGFKQDKKKLSLKKISLGRSCFFREAIGADLANQKIN
jgi:hypothetical protein